MYVFMHVQKYISYCMYRSVYVCVYVRNWLYIMWIIIIMKHYSFTILHEKLVKFNTYGKKNEVPCLLSSPPPIVVCTSMSNLC